MSDRALNPPLGRGDWDAAALLAEYSIADHLHGGIERYLKDGILPGGFLAAVLRNDLKEAARRVAPPLDANDILRIVAFLQAEAPATAWGSPEAVEAHVAERQAHRREEVDTP